ncbi:hypothetical protein GIY56_16795 [Paracoccus sp. YIM 132242]|uniref:Uncharacterized protein n=1 Tax=Paracoccus lichenicola TaxID=2665644 RepID=A0A6L6HUF6_9RHOB|nr:hypothetical protein [Paracoccus lichenicola]MTE01950.1 hypothetical protein [Paracoccus lichenicola]
MPNVKIYIDEACYQAVRPAVSDLLPDLRVILCEGLEVTPAACQFAVLPVLGLPDQPRINAELHVMPRPSRTRDRLEQVAGRMRDSLSRASGLTVAIRIAQLDAATYVALK